MGRSSPAAPGGGASLTSAAAAEEEDNPASTSFAAGGGWLGGGTVRFAGGSSGRNGKSAATAASRPRPRGHHLSDADLDEPVPRELTELAAPHVESFDAFLERGLDLVVERLPAVEYENPATGITHRYWFENPSVGMPLREGGGGAGGDSRLMPRECREMGTTYKAPLSIDLCWSSSPPPSTPQQPWQQQQRLTRRLGSLPVMVKSRACYLRHLSRRQLVAAGEESTEFGGYFVCNGIERVLRALVAPRRHVPLGLRRGAYARRGQRFTDLAVSLRCVRADETSSVVRAHYLSDGGACFAVTISRAEYFIPAGVLLRALSADGAPDAELFARLVRPSPAGGGGSGGGRRGTSGSPAGVGPMPAGDAATASAFVADRAEAALRSAAAAGLRTRAAALAHLGTSFAPVLGIAPGSRVTAVEAGRRLLDRHVFVHVGGGSGCSPRRSSTPPSDDADREKLDVALSMLRKLYALASGVAAPDDADAATNHEILLPGTLMSKMMHERLAECLRSLVEGVGREASRVTPSASSPAFDPGDPALVRRLSDRMPDVGKKAEYMINTGNLTSDEGLDLPQATGFSVVAEKLNYARFLSHFRSVHRGAYFSQLRTTAVRKLRPESWGFLCPVHTPDGAPCGLLNHFTAACRIVPPFSSSAAVVEVEDGCGGGGAGEGGEAMEIDGDGGGGGGGDDPHRRRRPATSTTTAGAAAVVSLLSRHGMLPPASRGGPSAPPPPPSHLEVQVDGRVGGTLPSARAAAAVAALRAAKAASLAEAAAGREPPPTSVPAHAEVVHVPFEPGGPYPGLFVLTGAGRMVRPVIQLEKRIQLDKREVRGSSSSPSPSSSSSRYSLGPIELIGTLEQSFLSIRCPDGSGEPGGAGGGGTSTSSFSHTEPGPGAMLSVLASLTPFSDHNQSPRNMYQCQMAKQTMGTPATALAHRSDGKLYRLHSPQAPLAATAASAGARADEYPSGTNMIVAVLAYTGYDMEDAMILNKAAVDRGLAHGSVIKTEAFDLREEGGGRSGGGGWAFAPEAAPPSPGPPPPPEETAFGQTLPRNRPPPSELRDPPHRDSARVDGDGLPRVGAVLYPGASYVCRRDSTTGRSKAARLKGDEVAVVERVTACGVGPATPSSSGSGLQRATVTLRINRNPVVGDKFSSRHGQKGVLSRPWPDADMPFAESTGMRPDLIINPHAFPSRMTIGMLLESLCSKAGALRGEFVDATPFAKAAARPTGGRDEEDAAASAGDALEELGFSRLGSESLVSGVTGERFEADIFLGPVYYQRLRHMVSDKFQVRSVGPVNPLTRQPVKGRKAGGGVRFGEMERDALLSHGAAYLLHDRLHLCSDYGVSDVCGRCGSVLSPATVPRVGGGVGFGGGFGGFDGLSSGGASHSRPRVVCRSCGDGAAVRRVPLPHVFRYLAAELAAMNIKTVLTLTE